MPAVSKAQWRAMKAAAAGKSTLGIPKSVGQDFSSAGYPSGKPERIKHPEGNKAPIRYGKKGQDITGKYSMTDKY
jgi:hypothetical protein